jgi:hypothetical protein
MANTRKLLTVGRKLLKMLLPPLTNLPLQPGHRPLDDVLRDIGLAGDQWIIDGCKAYCHLQAAQAYVTNPWMHTPWLTAVVAKAMLGDLMGPLEKESRWVSRWWHGPYALLFAGSCLLATTRFWGTLLLVGGIVERIVWLRNAYFESKLDAIFSEINSKVYSGGVLAERLERLNGLTLKVPSILVEVLRI